MKPFWVVIKATPVSTVKDICFETTAVDLVKQANGGLNYKEVVDSFTTEGPAKALAKSLIEAARKKK